MSASANLALPFIEGGELLPDVTLNETLRLIDTLVQLAIVDRDLNAPPGSPAEGQRWIVKASPSPTGAWAGHGNQVAAWQDGGWVFRTPRTGWLAYLLDESALIAWNGTAWVDAGAMLTTFQNLSLLGLGMAADATNPFSAKLNNALWVAKTVAEGGDGHLRYKLSKESAAKTLSLLMQTNFSGRAEIGLTGDDNLHFKVSADGSAWLDALVIDKSSGKLTVGQGFASPPAVRAFAAAAPADALAFNGLGLNAGHEVSQEFGATAKTGIGSAGGDAIHVVDHKVIRAKGSLRVSAQQVASSYPGIPLCTQISVTTTQSSLGSTDHLALEEPVEGIRTGRLAFGSATALPFSIGWLVNPSVAMTLGGYVQNSARNRSVVKEFSAAANAWTFVKAAGVAGDQSGTWLTDTGVGLRAGLTLAAGSALQGTPDAWTGSDLMATAAQTNLAATASASVKVIGPFLFWGMDLPEQGFLPSLVRPLDLERALARRYFVIFGGANANEPLCVGTMVNATNADGILTLPVPMRAAVSLGYSAVGDWCIDDGSFRTCTAIALTSNLGALNDRCGLRFTTASSLTGNIGVIMHANATTNARLSLSARL